MRRLILSVSVVGSFAVVSEAHALEADCMSKFGECSVSNVPDDSTWCECVGGGAGGGGGGNEWQNYNQAELQAACEEQLALFCGPIEPPDGIPCESKLGVCYIDNEPDSLSCECAGGEGGGIGGGGDMWDGLSDEELQAVCFEELEVFCGNPPDPEWMCENKLGGCSIQFDDGEDPFVSCGCTDGGGGFFPGDPEWAGLSEEELMDVCFMQIDDTCNFVDPSDSDSEVTTDSESESDSEVTTDSDSSTDSDPTDSGTTGTEGGTDETGTETTGDSESDSAESEGSSGSASATENPTATDSASDSDSASMTDASASASASNTAGEESSSGGDGGADGGESPSGCSCDAAKDEPPLGLALGLIGLVGLRIKRRWRR